MQDASVAPVSDGDPMIDVERFEAENGDTVILRIDGAGWQVVRCNSEGARIWTEWSIDGTHPFNEEEARAEFDRWRV